MVGARTLKVNRLPASSNPAASGPTQEILTRSNRLLISLRKSLSRATETGSFVQVATLTEMTAFESRTTPTISRSDESALMPTRRPIGWLPARKRSTKLSLTTASGADRASSSGGKLSPHHGRNPQSSEEAVFDRLDVGVGLPSVRRFVSSHRNGAAPRLTAHHRGQFSSCWRTAPGLSRGGVAAQ